MGSFAYVARDAAGHQVTGTVAAASEQAVLAELQGRDLAPVRLHPLRRQARWQRRVPSRHLATAYRQLADLLRVGMPLLRALELLGKSRSNPRLAAVMSAIADDVVEGSRLADAMTRHTDVFPSIQVAMIRAGERGGFLEQVFARLGAFLEHQADLRAKVIGNLIYPVVLLTVGLAIVVAALVFFVPKFQDFYSRIELPLPTKILLGASALLTQYWLIGLLGIVAAALGYFWIARRSNVQHVIARWQLRVPKLGGLVASLAIARFTRILGTLLGNGVPMLSAIQISRDAVGHVLLSKAIDEAGEAVRAGEPLAKPLADCGMFPEDVAEMIAVGESANNLPEVLITIAETIEKRVDRMLNLFVRLMEPLLLLGLAGVVLFIFVALIVPMLRMSSAISQG
ncbi:MAG: type II secretion system F family protein [Planctomycetota bacterium]|jgi:general secretion pathway protein F/type IV pilus assembly protein PilC